MFVQETLKVGHLLFRTTIISVPNLVIFLCMVHRAATDSRWGRRRKPIDTTGAPYNIQKHNSPMKPLETELKEASSTVLEIVEPISDNTFL